MLQFSNITGSAVVVGLAGALDTLCAQVDPASRPLSLRSQLWLLQSQLGSPPPAQLPLNLRPFHELAFRLTARGARTRWGCICRFACGWAFPTLREPKPSLFNT